MLSQGGTPTKEMEITVKRSLAPESLRELIAPLQQAHKEFESQYPGPRGDRQPVHTVYGGAHLFRADTARRLGEKALQSLDEYAPDFITFAKGVGLPGADRLDGSPETAALLARSILTNPEIARRENRSIWFAHTAFERVREKLRREPVEDFRIDFEDGFGNRPDDEEDHHAAAAAREVAAGMMADTLPPFVGIRIKPFNEELRNRSVRTLDIFLTELVAKTEGKLPQNFFITLPKITIPEESAALAAICSRLESCASAYAGHSSNRIDD